MSTVPISLADDITTPQVLAATTVWTLPQKKKVTTTDGLATLSILVSYATAPHRHAALKFMLTLFGLTPRSSVHDYSASLNIPSVILNTLRSGTSL